MGAFVTKCVRSRPGNTSTHISRKRVRAVAYMFRHAERAAHPDRRRPPRDPRAGLPRADQGGLPRQRCGRRPRHAPGAGRQPHRPDPARPHAAGRGRPVAVPEPARQVEHPDHHADRQGRRGGPRDRPGDGRRRLPAQALRQPRTRRPHQGRPAAQPRNAAAPGPDERPKQYRFDRWRLDTGRRELVRDDGTVLPLSTGEYDLLVASWSARSGC